jgi:hypothetical protein
MLTRISTCPVVACAAEMNHASTASGDDMTKTAILLMALLAGCTAPDRSRETLDSSGFTNIEIGDYTWFGCSEGDRYHTAFTATNSNGKRVSGVVCCGTLKSCTVRF